MSFEPRLAASINESSNFNTLKWGILNDVATVFVSKLESLVDNDEGLISFEIESISTESPTEVKGTEGGQLIDARRTDVKSDYFMSRIKRRGKTRPGKLGNIDCRR